MKDWQGEVVLNLGSGTQQPDCWVNVDGNEKLKPDLCFNLTHTPWGIAPNQVDKVVLHHVIEHLPKRMHTDVLYQINKVLKMGGQLLISYPDFERCAKSFIDNKNGNSSWYEQTIFGLRRYPGDEHVCAVTDSYINKKLLECGFDVFYSQNPLTPEYTDCLATKGQEIISYEDLQKEKWL